MLFLILCRLFGTLQVVAAQSKPSPQLPHSPNSGLKFQTRRRFHTGWICVAWLHVYQVHGVTLKMSFLLQTFALARCLERQAEIVTIEGGGCCGVANC
jgi:hypothetical protein